MPTGSWSYLETLFISGSGSVKTSAKSNIIKQSNIDKIYLHAKYS